MPGEPRAESALDRRPLSQRRVARSMPAVTSIARAVRADSGCCHEGRSRRLGGGRGRQALEEALGGGAVLGGRDRGADMVATGAGAGTPSGAATAARRRVPGVAAARIAATTSSRSSCAAPSSVRRGRRGRGEAGAARGAATIRSSAGRSLGAPTAAASARRRSRAGSGPRATRRPRSAAVSRSSSQASSTPPARRRSARRRRTSAGSRAEAGQDEHAERAQRPRPPGQGAVAGGGGVGGGLRGLRHRRGVARELLVGVRALGRGDVARVVGHDALGGVARHGAGAGGRRRLEAHPAATGEEELGPGVQVVAAVLVDLLADAAGARGSRSPTRGGMPSWRAITAIAEANCSQ